MDLALKIITALATLTIGIAASILAYQQYKISKAKLRFDLYDKRLTLFNRLRDYASEVAMTSKDGLEILDDAGKFYRDTIECQFLFDEDISGYFKEVYEKGKQLSEAKLGLERPNLTQEEREAFKHQVVELKTWFFDQSDEVFKVFAKDLSIKTLR